MAYSLTRAERETIVRFNLADNRLSFSSTDPAQVRRFDKLAAAHPGDVQIVKRDSCGIIKAYAPRSWFRGLRAPVARPPLSDERRVLAAENMRRFHAARRLKQEHTDA